MQNESPGYLIESVDNALQLVLMLQANEDIRVTSVARELGVAPSTAHRLLASLCHRGFAVRDEARLYHAGPALRGPEPLALSHDRIRMAVRAHLERLSAKTGETVHLVVREGTDIVFVDGIEGTQVLRVGGRVGTVLPAHCTSGGKALLAELASDDLTELYAGGVPEWHLRAARDLPGLRRRLGIVRQQGFALNRSESEAGVTAIGACVRTRNGRAVGAMSVSVPELRARAELLTQIAPALLTVVKEARIAV